MKKSYNTEQRKKCKTDFINGKLPDPFCVNHEIAASWQRCINLGLDQSSDKLPEPSISSVESILIGRALYNYREWLSGFLESEAAICKVLRCVSINLDSNMNVLSLLGDEDLVERLADEVNLKEGSNLAESVAGTNAVALAHRHGKECWVFGEEHYISALCNYVTVSYWLSPSTTSNFTSYGSMFIIPVTNYKDCLKPFFHFLSTTRETFKLCQQTPLHIMRGMLSDLYLQNVPIGYLIIDREGAILEYNEFAFNLIGERSCALPSDYLQECYPKLAFVKEYIKSNTQRYSSIVYINETVGSIKVDVHPMVGGQQEASGAIILVTSPGFVPFKSPVSPDGSALKRRAIEQKARYTFASIHSVSPSYLSQIEIAKKASGSNSNVLVLGESGTGKELVAQAIHNASSRKNEPFVAVNCASIPRELLSSELFGYVGGAFTGARKNGAPGKIELSNGGTLFLDEIGEMPLDMQVHLLRVLEERVVSRLGDTVVRPVDLRVIASTNRDLSEMKTSCDFRLDLFYRLNVITILLPPLREHPDDIAVLAKKMLEEQAESVGRVFTGISPDALSLLQKYSWPGNAREMRNLFERFSVLTENNYFDITDIPTNILNEVNKNSTEPVDSQLSKQKERATKDAESESEQIKSLLMKFKGNKAILAEELGISRPTLYRKIKELGLPMDRDAYK